METERSAGGPESISEAANLLANAKVTRSMTTWNTMGKFFAKQIALDRPTYNLTDVQNPVIISGGGVVMGGGVDAVVQLAEAIKVHKIN